MTKNERLNKVFIFLKKERLVYTQRDFSDIVGQTPSVVSEMLNNKRDVSEVIIRRICEQFEMIDYDWLLTGEGEMLKNQEPPKREGVIEITSDQIKEVPKGTPVYDLDATCGREFRDLTDESIIGYVDLPEINPTSHILQATGDSMIPKIYNGDRVVLREVYDKDIIFYGQIYLVLTDEYRMLKYVRKSKNDDNNVILRSENSEYDDIEINKVDILKMFVVENILSVRNML